MTNSLSVASLYSRQPENSCANKEYYFSHMGWIRWTGKALEFAGKLVQAESFEKWAEGKGEEVIKKVALGKSDSIFKSADSKAKADIWRDLTKQFAANDLFTSSMTKAIENYPKRFSESIGSMSYKLPRRSSSKVLVIPPFILRSAERSFWEEKFGKSQELAELKGGPELRAYFFDEMVRQLEAAFSTAAQDAGPSKPMQLPASRWVIGFNPDYEWDGRKGHYYVFSYYSQTAEGAKRNDKKAAEQIGVEDLEKTKQWLFELSPEERRKLVEDLPADARAAAAAI